MAKLSTTEKASRVLVLLLALRNPRIARALAAHGFDAEQLAHGWRLLQRLTAGCMEVVPPEPPPHPVRSLDAWENYWFPIVVAVLKNQHPEAYELVFRNIRQTEGVTLIVTIGALLDRLELLAKSRDEGGLGAEGQEARALLRKRGFTDEVMAEARAILRSVGQIQPGPDLEDYELEREAGERELWSWYLMWSSIARHVISDRRLLRTLGFLRRNKKGGALEPTDDED